MIRYLVCILLLFGCGPIDPGPEVDENGDPIETVEPYDSPLRIVSIEPSTETLHPTSDVLIRFDRYLEDDTIVDFSAVALLSGGRRTSGRVILLNAERAVRFRPSSQMIEGLDYTLFLSTTQFFSETGAPLSTEVELPLFRIDSSAEPVTFDRSTPVWADVDEIFERKCNSCHSDPQFALRLLDFESLVGAKSDQVDRFLVRKFDPADSYLLQKILPDYASRRFTVQPPPWSDAEALTDDEVQTIEFWIAAGAPLE